MAGKREVWLPSRAVMTAFWRFHRALVRYSGRRLGLWRARPGREGAMWLTTRGRRTGSPRGVILAYIEDGPNLVTLAMNGWGAAEPAWWLNLQAGPDVTVDLPGGPRPVRARAARGAERDRLWDLYRRIDPKLDAYARLRPTETAVVVLEPR
ncbi:nitroreductase family deazaflavin-dependent oxidoreductase [Catenuloplanes indicus]|uniref:Deazaflavin-dependent oxidoreductase (Nitroreductase family) n=1 Tax=Catenuloplanes indicus TaxID=137267 RepID=A0AAE4AXY4_9ACTN|nr:nitroreductase family deazaflavin-dependent oxidoreductase [Catenuloplanes indicus]MDQ0364503.1 deazaflavin-dependent oxidoreductase (nitroreductase family) [Catenuloplanes indicus]